MGRTSGGPKECKQMAEQRPYIATPLGGSEAPFSYGRSSLDGALSGEALCFTFMGL